MPVVSLFHTLRSFPGDKQTFFSNVAMLILFFAHFVIFVNKLSRGKCFFLSVLLH